MRNGEQDRWQDFAGLGYRLQDLGRPAVFFIPTKKLGTMRRGKSVEDRLHAFLQKKYGAFTTSSAPYFGAWHDGQKIAHDECRLYEVSFVGPKRIKTLIKELAKIARIIKEDCIYFKAGEDTCLIYPSPRKRR